MAPHAVPAQLLILCACLVLMKCQDATFDNEETDVTGMDIFAGTIPNKRISGNKSAWKFRSSSPPLVALKTINDSTDFLQSISIEFQVKINKKGKMSLLRLKPSDSLTWLEILMEEQNINIIINNNVNEPEIISFMWPRPFFKKWAKFILSIHDGNSISLWDYLAAPQTHELANRISRVSSTHIRVEVAGRSDNAAIPFSGLIRKGYIHIPAMTIPTNSEINKRTSLKKRGALRKPSSPTDTGTSSQHRRGRQASRTDDILSSLRSDVDRCRNENSQMNAMITMLKHTQTLLEQRVSAVERCECVPVCVTEGGLRKSEDETWNTDQCTTCTCNAGRITCVSSCQTPCDSNPCRNHGMCVGEGDGFHCRCRGGFQGRLCESVDHCYRVTCRNGGECRQLDGSYTCSCHRGYTGQHCEVTDHCAREPCYNGAQCVNEHDSYRCICTSGYMGMDCRYEDACSSHPCRHDGVCRSDGVDGYTCECAAGFTGSNCHVVDYCSSAPCLNGAVCSNTPTGFMCRCHRGHTGHTCAQVDHCSTQPCMNGATCSNVGDGFQCQCADNYYGRLCESRDYCTSAPCLNGGVCETTRVGFTCSCPSSYVGMRCERRDACFSHPCMHGGTCSNTEEGFICRCRRTHYGDMCEHSNYCRAQPCMNGASCANIPLSSQQPFTCTCARGFVGNLCQTQDFCRPNPCLNGGGCSTTDTTYECICEQPYMGRRCESIDYCARNPCMNGGRCRVTDRGFQCTCPRTHHGTRCERPHPCRNNPCLNGGKCRANGRRGYSCTCPDSHYGTECEHINHCRIRPCYNGASCVNQPDGFVCLCRDGYSGTDCSIETSCRNNPCMNGGSCQSINGTVSCSCPDTHKGPRCEYQCNVCLHAPSPGVACTSESVVASQRWYFNKFTQSCKAFRYSGCGGNNNNFASRQECRMRCIIGSCCILKRSSGGAVTKLCKVKSLSQCKRLSMGRKDMQVIGFRTGEECSETSCGIDDTCVVGSQNYIVGSSIDLGCSQSCICRSGGYIDCPCTETSVRREVRRLTTEELQRYHNAIRRLKTTMLPSGGNIWDDFRDEYIFRAPLAQSSMHFLMWNRAFLRKVEMLLQRVNCDITIPYYDFTIDAGEFDKSIIWQPNYFGGDGDCVPDHPFRFVENHRAEQWEPCLVRDFNHSVTIPNMVDVAMAMRTSNLNDLGHNLLSLLSYVKAYIGGDMATTSCAYDPLFYSIHAYIDNLFAQWQATHTDVTIPLGSNSVPLGLSSELVWLGGCVSYVDGDHHVPCNRSSVSEELFADDGFNLQGYNREGFDRSGYARDHYNALGIDRYGRHDTRSIFIYNGYNAEGYNRSGVDRRGFNCHGFCNGVDRDGYDEAGYDKLGFNRYGLDSMGYDFRGYSMYGVSMDGEPDTTDFYDEETGLSDCCFSRDGFTVDGVDKYGFTAARFDSSNCNYFYGGPHALHHQQKLWEILSIQPKTFLLSLQRPCGELSKQPSSVIMKNWHSSATLSKLPHFHSINSTFAQRMCLDVDMLLTWCPCLEGEFPSVCHINPCENADCPLHPGARCRVNFCARSCSSEFYLAGRRVNCEDPCLPNPCFNGGTCVPSRFAGSSESFSCRCLNEFTGSLCGLPAADTCVLPVRVGGCQESIRRWYYNQVTTRCEEFQFSGCGGNSNNFPNQKACNLRCAVGACCYRAVRNSSQLIGFDPDGYDKYGFNNRGYDRRGNAQSSHNSLPFGNQVLGPKGFGPDGFNVYGYNERGCDRQGYNHQGYHCNTGFNRNGYNERGGYDQLRGFGEDGFDPQGFNRDGFRCNGLNSHGYNQLGFYKEYVYNCHTMSLFECGAMRLDHEVIRFSPGKSCDQVDCGDRCGCDYNGKLYKFGETFEEGCQQCTCTLDGTIQCVCQNLGMRKEIRDLTPEERRTYAAAIRKLYDNGQWDFFVNLHSEYFPHANGATTSLPWHRYFLKLVEREVQKQSSCNFFIPYFDWTIDVGSLNRSIVWSATYFGGNGDIETNCVLDHPFDGMEDWHPCIRRRFNTSLSLPSAIDFHLLLHESNYEDFRFQLELMSSLFHAWVGGHMTSPFSPYDPVYLSHWAFMDHIWTEWQKKNPNGVSRFPSAHRYVQLKPFDVTPDDILLSQQQTCVNYIPATLGSQCNATTHYPSLLRNNQGFDRHGFDENGRDILGYDREGYSIDGRLDKRNSFNKNGYSVEGFKRSGFDSQGWDRYGFSINEFNRDGIDIEGYDASGYDRYGFDRNGRSPCGMFRNGSIDHGVDSGYVASLFNRYGYNRLGFDEHGLDHNGFNAYGFNVQGFDQDDCNFYQSGPHYMRFHFFATMQLKQMQENTLMQIKRICPPVSQLPTWIANDWLHDMDRVKRLEVERNSKIKIDPDWTPRNSSVTDDQLWTPITPDQQFCFDLRWNSGCPLGSPMMECEHDMCLASHCASHPHALCRMMNCGSCYPEFYDGASGEVYQCYGCIDMDENVHMEASTWEEGCKVCTCQSGMIQCTPMMCPSTKCSHPSIITGTCCPSCRDCDYGGEIHRDGAQFQPSSCERCVCDSGSVSCTSVVGDCPTPTCINPMMLPGDCCPSCPTSCGGHAEGAEWSMGPCHTCRCQRGLMQCRAVECPVVQCSHPHKENSQCCPTCQDCSLNGRVYRNGQNFMNDTCSQCSCAVHIESGAKKHMLCNTPDNVTILIKGCTFEGRLHRNGETFNSARNQCLNCTCQNNDVKCSEPRCPEVNCPNPIQHSAQCCPQCEDCSHGNLVYRNLQVWTTANGCQRCLCQRGNVQCQEIIPCGTCSHGVTVEGQCCKECMRCSYHGTIYRDRETFTSSRDPCQRCVCQRGSVTCTRVTCPPVSCLDQHRPPGQCCPQCPGCTDGLEQWTTGSSWQQRGNPCMTCTCKDGDIRCSSRVCPDVTCDNPATMADQCCPTCARCAYHGVVYGEGETVVAQDACQQCTCSRGNVECSEQVCEAVSCPSPVIRNGECCPRCVGCVHKGSSYEDGGSFTSQSNPCLTCTCQAGEVSCRRMECPSVQCTHAGRRAGECCATCDGCDYERRNYRNGERFTPVGSSACISCICQNGGVQCTSIDCPQITCHNPTNIPGQCCPVCQVCSHDGEEYEYGEIWYADSCTTCACDGGKVDCTSPTCPTAPCSHPAKLSGSCCRTCEMCELDGHTYSSTTTFPHPSEPCRICQCQDGNVACRSRPCPALSCTSPIHEDGTCCPSCPTSCTVGTSQVEEGDSAPHPTNPCLTCTCQDGNLNCTERCNSPPKCSHPTDGRCCRDNCDGCHYRGRSHDNGEVFAHHRDKCRSCSCINGNVRCRLAQCRALSCSNPVHPAGDCCPRCPDTQCVHNDREYADQERFVDGCHQCRCASGSVTCKPISCDPTTCTHPVRDGCCRSCTGCRVNHVDYQNGDVVPDSSSNACEVCRCLNGNLVCRARRCPVPSCSHPTMKGCCPACEGCLYNSISYHDGSSFESFENPCELCTCSSGNVGCERVVCSEPACTHPDTPVGGCCPTCDGCRFGSSTYDDGAVFASHDNTCLTCVCSKGTVSCVNKPCAEVACSNPSIGSCDCPVCSGCSYNGVTRRNRETFTNPEDERCSQCYCQDGNVVCGRKQCPSSTCTHPTLDPCGCPLCERCLFNQQVFEEGDEVIDPENSCNSCICEDGNIQCESRPCEEVACHNPTFNKCGCPLCESCNYMGVTYSDNERFIDSMNKCNLCVCSQGTVQCIHTPCPAAECANPVVPEGECCSKCVGSCDVDGVEHEDGSIFPMASDPCSSCSCSQGVVRCIKLGCERSCSHPREEGACCPDCSGCRYQDTLYEDGQFFNPPDNPCRRCSCYEGNVLCRDTRCPVPDCAKPETPSGECCPKCTEAFTTACAFRGRVYEVGMRWLHRGNDGCGECLCDDNGAVQCTSPTCEVECTHSVPSIHKCCGSCENCFYLNQTWSNGHRFQPNACQDCVCINGNIQCVTKACRPLSCPLNQQVHSPGSCCPRCANCSAVGYLFAEDETWISPMDHCLKCQCHNGVVTCGRTRCIVPCQSTVAVPGQCCPVCRGCTFNNMPHEIGSTFEANPMDPCEVCECSALISDSPSMTCHRVMCPSLADCPRTCIVQPDPGTCCPTCAPRCTYGTCGSHNIGEIAIPHDNRCMSCECNANHTWLCSPTSCPPLDCPQSDRYTPKGTCCPICDRCYLDVENRNVASGFSWRVSECQSCRCDLGSIVCSTQQCPMLDCPHGMLTYKQPGDCCEECIDPSEGCVYDGHTVAPQHRWLVDKCTTCQCFAGRVNCVTQRCRMLMCNSDEAPSVTPGECCPHCIPRPASCIAFGDPHYQTFDGRMIHFQGTCRYLLTADCSRAAFRVEVENRNIGGDTRVSWTDRVHMTVAHHRITVDGFYNVMLNGTQVPHLPLLIKPYIFIDKSANTLLINTHLGVRLSWNALQHHLQVEVPSSFKKKLCGLCGNFNNLPQDDLRLRNSRIARSDIQFGNNWKVLGREMQSCPDATPYNPCDAISYRKRKRANNACKVINSDLFAQCHQVVSPAMYFSACVHDVCACGGNEDYCLCDVLETYAAQCRRAGVVVRWRSSTLCALNCPSELGYVFDECGSPCKRTCANTNLPPSVIEEQCYMPCVSGCQCPAGMVEYDGRCINSMDCPDTISVTDLPDSIPGRPQG